jgi:hypothetical protein
VEPTQFGPIDRASPYLQTPASHKIVYINKAQHKPYVRVKANIKNIKKLHTRDLAPMSMHCFVAFDVKIRVLSE